MGKSEGNGGGGITRVIANGNVFEKGGVNTSVVYGHVTDKMRNAIKNWMALNGLLRVKFGHSSCNPFVPTVHCNYRMFELYNEKDECNRQVVWRWN